MRRNLLMMASLTMSVLGISQTVVFNEDFENTESVAQWSLIDKDGDGENWEILNAELNELTTFSGNFAVSFSWYLEAFTPDNILLSPKVTLPDNSQLELSFKVGSGDDELFDEHYAVYVIPATSTFSGSETPVFEETLDASYMESGKTVKVDISSFAGQEVKLAFRHYNCEDIFYIGIDDVKVTQTPKMAVTDVNTSRIKLYPNPTSDILKIEGINTLEKVRIFDMSGKLVKEVKDQVINIKDLEAGQYIVNVYSGNEVISNRIIKK